MKFFDTPKYPKHWSDVHKIFRHCEIKIFRQKIVIPPIVHKFSRYLILSEFLKGCPKKFFGTGRPKMFAGKRDTLYYTWNVSIRQVIWNIERMRTNFFGTVRQKNFNWKMWYQLLCIKTSVTPNYLKHWRDAHEIFRPAETKTFHRKNVISLIKHETFRYPNFSETLNGSPQKTSALWDKKFSAEKGDIPYYA